MSYINYGEEIISNRQIKVDKKRTELNIPNHKYFSNTQILEKVENE